VAQAALDTAVRYAREREAFGKAIIRHEGLAFLLADMAAAVESARATYLHADNSSWVFRRGTTSVSVVPALGETGLSRHSYREVRSASFRCPSRSS
jgi:alkylation response protein AidB-like acyl-CoA dehydrogenase